MNIVAMEREPARKGKAETEYIKLMITADKLILLEN
jgi:hypothetical protein